jgi:hypothetical protein
MVYSIAGGPGQAVSHLEACSAAGIDSERGCTGERHVLCLLRRVRRAAVGAAFQLHAGDSAGSQKLSPARHSSKDLHQQ